MQACAHEALQIQLSKFPCGRMTKGFISLPSCKLFLFILLNRPLHYFYWHFTICISAVWVFPTNSLLLWQTALHHTHWRHILQLPKQVNNPASAPVSAFVLITIIWKLLDEIVLLWAVNVAFLIVMSLSGMFVIFWGLKRQLLLFQLCWHLYFFFSLLYCIIQKLFRSLISVVYCKEV